MFNFETFYKHNFPRIKDLASTFNLQNADCEDITQEIFRELWSKISDGRANPEDEKFLGYVNKLARWRIVDKYRRVKSLTRDFNQIGEDNDMDELPFGEVINNEWKIEFLKKAAKNTKSKIKTREFKYFCEMTFGGKSSEDICNIYGVKKSYVYLTKHRVGNRVIESAKQLLANGIQPF